VIKAYFDGGNRCDSRVYDTATLACIIGRPSVLRNFERLWKTNLAKHHISYLHTTDAMALQGIYKKHGWGKPQRDSFLNDCADIIAACALQPHDPPENLGKTLVPTSTTLELLDFKKVQAHDGPQDATQILATNGLGQAVTLAGAVRSHFIELFFDRNEPYRGHVQDRLVNPRFLREMKRRNMDLSRYMLLGPELDMRDVPELQAADMFAWAVGNQRRSSCSWQQTLLSIPSRLSEWFDHDVLKRPDPVVDALEKSCQFPPRRPTP